MGDERVTGTGGRLRQLARHSFVYGLGGLVSKLVGIFLLPIYTHRVNQAQFGEVEQVMAFVAVAAVVLRMGLVTAMFRFCWDHREPDARARTIRTAFTAVLAMSTVGLVLCLLLINPLADVLSSSRELVLIGAFGLWVSMNFDILAGIYRIEQRPTAFVVYSLINVALTVVLSIILVIPLDLGAAGIMIGNFSGTYITYVLLLYARRETVALALDRPLLRRMLDFSLPLMPAGLALWALNLADRFQVINLASPSELGLLLGGVEDLARDHAADRGVPDGVGAVRQLVHRRGRGEAHLPGRLLVLVGADRLGGRGDEPVRAALHPPAHAARVVGRGAGRPAPHRRARPSTAPT